MQALFSERLTAAQRRLESLQLEYSFRSSSAILSMVDRIFHDRAGTGGHVTHRAFKAALPGRVDLWPVVPKATDPAPVAWSDPVDLKAENHPDIVLADRITDQLVNMIGKEPVPAENEDKSITARHVRAGDILILVQRRAALFHEIIRACKAKGLPVAGADRLKIGAELAVKDLTALLSFLATPEDSLSLAAALRSPLLGWTQRDLHALAQGRAERHLWETLRNRADDHPETLAMLHALRRDADFLRPYDLVERILTRHHGRRNLLARLGTEAEDGIDAMLSQALAYERMDVPSLTGFLSWLATDDVDIKRQMDSAGDRIRVMTVHGAKGLESPIVILPDCGPQKTDPREQVLLSGGVPLWKSAARQRPDALEAAHADLKARQVAERDRLLYVAMTRAEKWLIVTAAGDLGQGGDTWYDAVADGMETAGAPTVDFSFGTGRRWEEGAWPATAPAASEGSDGQPPVLPAWAGRQAPAPTVANATLAPSDIGGAKALPGEAGLNEEDAMLRGRRLHRLLEHLPVYPQADWPTLAADLLRTGEDAAPEAEAQQLLQEAARVLSAPDLDFLFGPAALAEVEISATLPDLAGRRIHGAIDRLIVEPGRVIAVDFKTNATVPATFDDVPVGFLRQMGAYGAALSQIYPGRDIAPAILWTRTVTLTWLPLDRVRNALCDTPLP